MTRSTDQHLTSWLRTHDGVISRRQAERLAIPSRALDRLLLSGRLERVAVGVFVDGAITPNPRTTLRAALVGAGREAVVSHRSAAWLWGLIDHPPRCPSITVPRGRRVQRPGMTIHRTLNPPLCRWHAGFPVTDPPRTIIDLAATMADRPLDLLIDRALGMRLVGFRQLKEAAQCDSLHRWAGAGSLRRRLAARGLLEAPHPSVLESHMDRLLGRLVQRGAVPAPEREVAVLDGRFRLDYAWPAVGLAVEVDGYVWHSQPRQMRHDLDRRNQLTLAGWISLVYVWAQVLQDSEAVMTEIGETYRRLAGAKRAR